MVLHAVVKQKKRHAVQLMSLELEDGRVKCLDREQWWNIVKIMNGSMNV